MLTQIVQPMVRTQLRLLAGCQSTRSTLTSTICQWLGFLGVQAQVDQLRPDQDAIQVSLTVRKPSACDPRDWSQILDKLHHDAESSGSSGPLIPDPAHSQQVLVRLFAYLIQVGHPQKNVNWEAIQPRLKSLHFDDEFLAGIRAALKVPQSLELFIDHLDADIAAIALPKAVSIALMDREVNDSEEQILSTLFQLMKKEAS